MARAGPEVEGCSVACDRNIEHSRSRGISIVCSNRGLYGTGSSDAGSSGAPLPESENWAGDAETRLVSPIPWIARFRGGGDQTPTMDSSISLDDDVADGFPHKYFARVAFVAVLLEDLPQIVLQTVFIVVIEGGDGWAITGAIASLTLSITDFMVKIAFPLCIKGIK